MPQFGIGGRPLPEGRATALTRAANTNELGGFGIRTPEGRQLRNSGSPLLIIYAWAMEVAGVGCGVLSTRRTTFGDNPPDAVWGHLVAVPMIVLAVAALGRIPLASAFLSRDVTIRCIWPPAIVLEGQSSQEANTPKREELRTAVTTREGSIAALADQVRAASEVLRLNLANIGQQSKLVRWTCIWPRSELEDRCYEAEVVELNSKKANEEQNKAHLVVSLVHHLSGELSGEHGNPAKRFNSLVGRQRSCR